MSYIAFLDSYFWYLVLLVNILVYLCGVRARKSANLFTRRAIYLQDGEGSNDNDDYNLAFPRGGPERGNPAMTTKRLRQGVKETHQHKYCGEKKCRLVHGYFLRSVLVELWLFKGK